MSALAVSQLLESSQEKGVELVLETSSFENQVIDSSVEVGNVKEILHWNQHIFKPSSTVHDTFFSHCRITFYYIEHLFVSSFLYDSNTILFRSRFDRTAFWFISNSAIYDYKYHTFLLHSTYGPFFYNYFKFIQALLQAMERMGLESLPQRPRKTLALVRIILI